MKLITNTGIVRFWGALLFAGMSLVSVSSESSAARVGDSYGGGVVFFVDRTGEHGLIAAKEDITSIYEDGYGAGMIAGAFRWSTGQYKIPKHVDYAEKRVCSTGTAIGSGAPNTKKILAKYPASDYPYTAAAVATAYRGGGFSDWFLPSREELNQLYLHKSVVDGFVDNYYWSSSEQSADHAWFEYFGKGIKYTTNKTHVNHVRPVRAF